MIAPVIAILALLLGLGESRAATTLLPNGEQCFQAAVGINGMVGVLGSITGGSAYVSGTYSNVPLTGGSGTLATANIVVTAGVVTSVVVINPGRNYVVADALSASNANLGGSGSGFSVPVASISVNTSLAGGSINMYVPATTTPKNTWKDANQSALNTNPIILDANGCAVIYGVGQYRQQVLDSLGNLIFDQLTTDTSAFNSVFWAGLSGGTPNAITITDVGFNATDGSVINFIASHTNTSATTLNPSSFGNIPILKATTAGLVALSGGEIIATGTANIVSVLYSASDSAFILLNTVIQSSGAAIAPLCGASGLVVTVIAATQVTVTANTLFMVTSNGLTINRSNVSMTLTTTNGTVTSTANGMDGEATPVSGWIDIFGIDNGSAPATLGTAASGNGLAPNMPSGYTYKCYLGAVYVNATPVLRASTQKGHRAQWIVGGSGLADPSFLVIANGMAGTASQTNPVLSAVAIGNWAPPTASTIRIMLNTKYKGNTTAVVLAAPNSSWGGANNGPQGSNGTAWPFNSSGTILSAEIELLLEGTNVYWASDATGGALGGLGWADAVNAN